MKEALIISLAILALLFATGPVTGSEEFTIGVSVVPAVAAGSQNLTLGVGWTTDDFVVLVGRGAFDTWQGVWDFSLFWTPPGPGFDWRLGPILTLNWTTGNAIETAIEYTGLAFALGVQQNFFGVNAYLQLTVTSEVAVFPVLGAEFQFFRAPAVQEENL